MNGLRITFDTNVIDALAAAPAVLDQLIQAVAAGKVILITTHIQEDELAATSDPERRDTLMDVYTALPTHFVATHGFVLDVSRLDMARLGDGGWTGVAIDDIDSPSWNHRRDALIGVTAAGEADVLETCERRLARRMEAAQAPCQVWNFERFQEYLRGISGDESKDESSAPAV